MASKEEEGDDFETNPSESPGEMLRTMLETVMELRQQRTEEINSLVEKMQQETETVMHDQSSVNTEDIQALHNKLDIVASYLKTDVSEMKTRRRIPPSRLCRMKSSSCNDVAATEFSTLELQLRIDALEKHVEMLHHTQEQSSTLGFRPMADSLAKLDETVAQLSKSHSESEKKLRLRLNALEDTAQQKKVVEDQKYSFLQNENIKLQQEIDELKSKLETEKPSESVKTSDFELWKTTLESEMSQMKAEIQGQKDKSLREELEKQRAELENLRKTFKKGKKALTDKIKDVSVLETIFNNRLAKKSKQVEEKLMELIKLQREKFKPKLDEIEHDVQVLWEAQDKLESREKNFVEEIEEMKYVQTDDEPLLLSSEVGKLILGQEVLMLQLGDMGEKLEVLQQDSDFRKHAWNKLIVEEDDTISKTELIAAVRQLGFKFEMMKEIIVNRVDRLEILRRNLAQLDKSVTKRQEIGDQVTHLQKVVKSLQLLIHDKDNTRTSHGTSKDMAATCASNFQFSWPRLDSTTFSGNVKQGSLGRPTSKSLLTSGVTAHPNVTSGSNVTNFMSSVTSSGPIVTSSAVSFASISSTSLFGNKKTENSTLAKEPFSGFNFGRPSTVMTSTTASAVKPLATVTSLALTAVASTASGSGALKTAVSSGFVKLTTTTSSSSIVTSSAVSFASISSSSLFSNKKAENSTLAKAPFSGFSFSVPSNVMTSTTASDKQISAVKPLATRKDSARTTVASTALGSGALTAASTSGSGALKTASTSGSGPPTVATTSGSGALTTATTSGSGALTTATTSGSGALTTATTSGSGALTTATTLSGFGALTSAATLGFGALTTTSSSGFGALTTAATLSGFGALTTTSPSPIVTVSFAPNGSASFSCDKKSQISTFSKAPLSGFSFSMPSNVMTSTTASDKQISAVKPLATGKDSARTTVASTALGSSSPTPALGSGALTTASTASESGALTTASTSGSGALTTASTSGSGALTTASTSGSGALTIATTSGSGALKTATTSGSDALKTASTSGSGALKTALTSGSGALTTASTSGSGALTTATTSESGSLTGLPSNTINTLTTLEEHESRYVLKRGNRARSRSNSRKFANLTFPRNFGFDAHNSFFNFPLAEEVASDFDLPETFSFDQNKILDFVMAGKESKPDANFTRFTPPSGQDTIVKKGLNVLIETSHICITAMTMYENKSLEELRWEEYQQDPKLLRKTFKFRPSQK